MDNVIDLSRFTRAHRQSYDTALNEIQNGRKVSHWMWYIFPQIYGLGYSETAQYYIGETFAETMQPQRSRVRHKENGFIIEHVSQRITVSMLAKADWNGDGDMEWIVSCTVVPKKGGHTKTWYLLVPPPENKEEILQGTPCALWDCFGQSCTLSLRDASKIRRTVKENAPLTEVKEFVPGEKTITTPPSEKTGNSALQERAL